MRDTVDPTPEEIAERCAEIRAGWTDAEHRQRAYNPIEAQQALLHEVQTPYHLRSHLDVGSDN